MIASQGHVKKFNLLFLEEGESYIKEFQADIRQYDLQNKVHSTKSYEARVHFGSRSLIIELVNEPSASMTKYLFKHFVEEPLLSASNRDFPMLIKVTKLIEIPCNQAAPQPYKTHMFTPDDRTQEYRLDINIRFGNINNFHQALQLLFSTYIATGNQFHYENDEVQEILSRMTKSLNNTAQANAVGGIMSNQEIKFNKSRLKNISEQAQFQREFHVKQILPLVEIEGLLFVTNARIYFQPYHNIYDKPVLNYKFDNFSEFFLRRFKLLEVGLQLKLIKTDRMSGQPKETTLLLCFQNKEERDQVYGSVSQYLPNTCKTEQTDIQVYTYQWVNGQITNFDYLQILNTYAQRSTLDLTQYPVFPWVIKDFTSPVLDLADPATYRDLKKPIGALNPKRLDDFMMRFNEMPDEDKYLYGTHYSCPGYVIGFLVRQHPQWMIKFQGGRYDNPNRLFKGIRKEWDSCLNNPGNVKELIPEFFMDNPAFLTNQLRLDMGVRSNGKRVDDIKLPKWASTPTEFLVKNREALESDYVSENLHLWIDLIFGSKQCSIEDLNVFHPVTYQGRINLEQLEDPVQRAALEVQITEFGQTPKQVFAADHPQKGSKMPKPLQLQQKEDRKVEEQSRGRGARDKGSKGSPMKSANASRAQASDDDEDDEEQKRLDAAQQSPVKQNQQAGSSISKFQELNRFTKSKIEQAHKKEIMFVDFYDAVQGNAPQTAAASSMQSNVMKQLTCVTASMDGFIKQFGTQDSQAKKCFFISQAGLTAATAIGHNSYALAGMNNEIYLFSFYQGTVVKQFSAHDDYITSMLCKQVTYADRRTEQLLITTSADQTIKLWEVTFGNPKQKALKKVLYDHEEEITSAFVAQQVDIYLLVTVDLEGWVIVRDLRTPDDYLVKVKPAFEEQYTAIEIANVLLNNNLPLLSGRREQEDLFITLNNQLFIYCLADQSMLANPIYNSNILKVRQERGLLVMAMDNDSIQCYDYERQQIVALVHNVTDNSGELLSMCSVDFANTQQAELVCGDSNGDLRLLKFPTAR